MIYIFLCILSVLLLKERTRKFLFTVIRTLPRDFKTGMRYLRLHIRIWRIQRKNLTVVKAFKKLVRKHPNKIAFFFEDQKWTYKQLDEFSDKIGVIFRNAGYQPQETVALLLNGQPEYVGIWLGLAKIRVITALVNTNLTKGPLLHSLQAANAKGFVYGAEFANAVKDISKDIRAIPLYEFGEQTKTTEDINHNSKIGREIDLRFLLNETKLENLESIYKKAKLTEKLLYIYTSGTTGLPKAAVITNNRYNFLTNALNVMPGFRKNDILYDPLPLYHTAGGIVGIGQCLLNGNSVAIRKKFSASNFWKDCNKYNCTVAQYIGEICRYLLAVPPTGNENQSVRMMYGNGLKAQIWEQFQKRFKVKQICEFYGSTEGNSNLINTDNKVGSVGFIPLLAPTSLLPTMLIKCDDDGTPIRDARGHCIKCKIGEPGVFIGRIQRKKVFNEFVGYADEQATNKKVLRDVFKKGDSYFNTGDVLIQDEEGYFFFKDRTGDTFRWKGENVATSEVEAVISNIVNLNDAVVYGVEVPQTEGRAGMAAIVDTNNQLDLDSFSKDIVKSLPNYALPIFLRVMKEVPLTGTFKLKKVDLQNEGFDVRKVADKLFLFDFKLRKYVELTHELFSDINSGKIRL